MKLKDKVAIITGSTRGFGRTTAILFAQEGAKVVVNGRNEEKAQEVTKIIKNNGGSAITCVANVTMRSCVERMVEETLKEYGRIDILVNNAGITKGSRFYEIAEEDWDEIINTNLKGYFLCAQTIGKVMMNQNYGKIVNVSSIYYKGSKGQLHYDASKGGIVSMTRSLALELAKYNVNVNCVAPGICETDMPKIIPQKVIDAYIKQVPLRRLGKAEEVANVILFLASDESSYITGQTIHIDGGLVRN